MVVKSAQVAPPASVQVFVLVVVPSVSSRLWMFVPHAMPPPVPAPMFTRLTFTCPPVAVTVN